MQSVTIKSKPLFLELCRLYQFKSYRKRHRLMREWGYKYFSSDTHEAVCFVYDERGRVHYKIELENLIITRHYRNPCRKNLGAC